MREEYKFALALIAALAIATFPFWYPLTTGVETKLFSEEGEVELKITGVLKEVGDYYVVVSADRGEYRIYLRGWYGNHDLKWYEVLDDLRKFVGYQVVMEVSDEGGYLVAKQVEVPQVGVKY